MKKTIGFIDLYINNWHANNYPAWFRAAKRAGEFELGYAYEETPAPGSPSLEVWCEKYGMRPAHDIKTVVANSDCLCVLAPGNPEAHDRLSALPLAAGKPLYIDKTFAPDKATAARFFETARRHGTPLMSTSALRYGEEFVAMMQQFGQKRPIHVTATGGGRSFGEYSIHQIEMEVIALGLGASSVMRLPGCATELYAVRYADGVRSALLTYNPNADFMLTAFGDDSVAHAPGATNMFPHLIDAMLEFYATGVSLVPEAETIEVAAIREAAVKAQAAPGIEIPVP